MKKTICIATDYTKKLGARDKTQGEYSGEDFRERFLIPFFNEKKNGDILEINLDGLNGYPSSFFEEAFGGLARFLKNIDLNEIKNSLRIICTDVPLVESDIASYIDEGRRRR